MKSRYLLAMTVVAAFAVAGCSGDEAELSTTSSLVTGTTETPVEESTTTTTEQTDTTVTTTLVGQTVESYEIPVRISGDNGEILYIVIPEGAYTDVDLENFIYDLRDADPDLWGAEVFDNDDAVRAYVIPEDQRTEDQQQLLEDHHFVSLIGGDTLRFQGPFSDKGEFIIGS